KNGTAFVHRKPELAQLFVDDVVPEISHVMRIGDLLRGHSSTVSNSINESSDCWFRGSIHFSLPVIKEYAFKLAEKTHDVRNLKILRAKIELFERDTQRWVDGCGPDLTKRICHRRTCRQEFVPNSG